MKHTHEVGEIGQFKSNVPGSSRRAGITAVRVSNEAEYLERAGDASVVPILSAAWEQFEATARVWAPRLTSPSREHWKGLVAYAEEDAGRLAAVLAGATGRPLVQVNTATEALSLSLDSPVTMVCEAGEVTPELLAAVAPEHMVGFLTASDHATASLLVAKNVLFAGALAGLPDVTFDAIGGVQEGERVLAGRFATPTALKAEIGAGAAILAGRAHGRDCLMHLHGGGICGRAWSGRAPSAVPLHLGMQGSSHYTACQQSDRCWRDDVAPSDHVRAQELRVGVAVLDGCRIAQVGEGTIGTEVSIPLSLLGGHALAVICGAGTRGGFADAPEQVRSDIRSGAAIGQALAAANMTIERRVGAGGKLILLGDAGLCLSPDQDRRVTRPIGEFIANPDSAAKAGEQRAKSPGHPSQTSDFRFGQNFDRSSSTLLALSKWVGRLQSAEALGITFKPNHLDAIKSRISAIDTTAAIDATREESARSDEVDSCTAALSAIQTDIARRELEWISSQFYQFTDGWAKPQSSSSSTYRETCPQCSRASVRVQDFDLLGYGADFRLVDCIRCGALMSGFRDFPLELRVSVPPEAQVGAGFNVEVCVSNVMDEPVRVDLVAAFHNGRRTHAHLRTHSAFTVGPGERRTHSFEASTGPDAVPDLHPLTIFIIAEGAVRAYSRSVWMRASSSLEAVPRP